MSKSNTFENDFLKLILWGTPIEYIADNAATGTATSYFLALHTIDPGEAGNQTSNEVSYGNYSRVEILRDNTEINITDNVATFINTKSFPQCTSGSLTGTYFSLGIAATGTGKILWSGSVSPPIVISLGSTPQLGAGTSITEN